MSKSPLLVLTLALLLAAAAPFESRAADDVAGTGGASINVMKRTNVVEFRQSGNTTWQPVFGQHRLATGDLARTNRTGKAQVRIMESQTTLAVGPSTMFTVARILEQAAQVDLSYGHFKAEVEGPKAPDRFQVVTPNATLSSQGTVWTTHYVSLVADSLTGEFPGADSQPEGWPGTTEPGHTRAMVEQGEVKATAAADGAVTMVKAGEMIDIPPVGPATLVPFAPKSGTGGIERGTVGGGEPASNNAGATPGSEGPITTSQPGQPGHVDSGSGGMPSCP